jgi:hypothetical protein
MTSVPTASTGVQDDQAGRQVCGARQRSCVVDVFARVKLLKAVDGIKCIAVQTGFEGLDPLQAREQLLRHARWGLWPILSQDAASSRQGDKR